MAGRPYTKAEQLGSARKKYRRTVASRRGWEKIRAERLGPCLICEYWSGGPSSSPIELHHVVPRDRGGDDVAANLVPLCRDHHEKVEQRRGAFPRILAQVIQRDDDAAYAYAVEKLGEDGFLRLHGVKFKRVPDA